MVLFRGVILPKSASKLKPEGVKVVWPRRATIVAGVFQRIKNSYIRIYSLLLVCLNIRPVFLKLNEKNINIYLVFLHRFFSVQR